MLPARTVCDRLKVEIEIDLHWRVEIAHHIVADDDMVGVANDVEGMFASGIVAAQAVQFEIFHRPVRTLQQESLNETQIARAKIQRDREQRQREVSGDLVGRCAGDR